MKLKLDKKHGNRIVFVSDGVSTSLANLIRRYGISRIQVLAIDSVTFYDNSSSLWDEYVSHRLGLMPITTPENIPESAEVIFSLDAEGPKTVYASDVVSSDNEIKIAQGAIPIVTLGQNQHLRFEAKAIVGTARTHAKFQSGLLSYGAEDDKGTLKFTVESFFQMEPYEIISRACDVILNDLTSIEEALGKKSEKPAKKKTAKKSKKEE